MIFSSVGFDLQVLFEGESSEEIDLEGDVVLDEPLEAIADSEDVALLDEFCCVSLEEGLGGTGLVGNNAVYHGDLETLLGVDDPRLGGDNLDVHVEAAAFLLKILDFDEFRLSKLFFFSHIC